VSGPSRRLCVGCPYLHVIRNPSTRRFQCWCAAHAWITKTEVYLSLKRADLVTDCPFEGLAALIAGEGDFAPLSVPEGRGIEPGGDDPPEGEKR
jgi:hypothetical protein